MRTVHGVYDHRLGGGHVTPAVEIVGQMTRSASSLFWQRLLKLGYRRSGVVYHRRLTYNDNCAH